MKNIREYQTIKFFRGKERNNAELQRLADAQLDFEYRRLLIEENELDLHVAFSKMIVWKWLSWSFLAMTIVYFQYPIISFIFLGMAIISQFLSFINKRFFMFVFRGYNLTLGFVDCVIYDKYGISLK